MKKRLLSILFIFLKTVAIGQTVIVSPTGDGGFETGNTFAANGWTMVNGTQTNKWWCGNIPAGLTGLRCGYISNHASGNTHNYATGNASVTHVYRDVTFPAAQNCINLSFSWVCDGEDGFFGNYDFLSVHVVSTATTVYSGKRSRRANRRRLCFSNHMAIGFHRFACSLCRHNTTFSFYLAK
ncbi:MAG: hypothetical protein IPO27_12265 [Bacteroidetes bacterium]|nr:hypothetical protein [Bacteroidota bacterium]